LRVEPAHRRRLRLDAQRDANQADAKQVGVVAIQRRAVGTPGAVQIRSTAAAQARPAHGQRRLAGRERSVDAEETAVLTVRPGIERFIDARRRGQRSRTGAPAQQSPSSMTAGRFRMAEVFESQDREVIQNRMSARRLQSA